MLENSVLSLVLIIPIFYCATLVVIRLKKQLGSNLDPWTTRVCTVAQETESERAARAEAEDSEARRQTATARMEKLASVRPVFRTSPYSAELRRARATSPTARILFLDEGNFCR